jgi:hypothetical protein
MRDLIRICVELFLKIEQASDRHHEHIPFKGFLEGMLRSKRSGYVKIIVGTDAPTAGDADDLDLWIVRINTIIGR